VHWTLARRAVRFPRWGGSRTDTRIAYLEGSQLRVVAGDGTGDAALHGLPPAAPVAPAWGPGGQPDLAYVDTRGRVYRLAANGKRTRWRSGPHARPRLLAWSPDGTELALATPNKVVLFDAETGAARTIRLANTAALAFARDGRLAIVGPGSARLADRSGRTQLGFAGARPLAGAAWSPSGRWLLLASPAADEWIFVRGLAVANMRAQFEGFPQPGGWCCAP
jgi:hypothetical protein